MTDFPLWLEELRNSILAVDFHTAHKHLTSESWEIPFRENDALVLLGACIASEVADYFGEYGRARHVLRPFVGGCYKALEDVHSGRRARPRDRQERGLLKQQLWAILHWGFVRYREGNFDEALGKFRFCREVLQKHLIDYSNPCFGTAARISYAIGLVHRQCYRYDEAKVEFTQCITQSWQHLENLEGTPGRSTDLKPITAFHVAKSLALGLGWILSNEGKPLAAQRLIASARVMLAATDAEMIKRYVDVVWAASERARAGAEPSSLRKVLLTLRASYGAFQRHPAYRIKTASELAVALIIANELDEAERYAKEIETFAGGDDRWLCTAYFLQSRIHRHRASATKSMRQKADFISHALDSAKKATERADGQQGDGGRFSRIDAYITYGEALLLSGKFLEAKGAFERVLGWSVGNEKVTGTCHLHLARVFVQLGQKANALQHLKAWRSISGRVTNAWLNSLGEEVEETVRGMKDFLIAAEQANLDERELSMMLKIHLRETALERADSIEAAAELCNVATSTFRSWSSLDKKLRAYRKKKTEGSDVWDLASGREPETPKRGDGHTTKIPVFFGTDRKRTDSGSQISFSGDRSESDSLNLGICEVTIPPGHKKGTLETPSKWWELQFSPNPRKHVTLAKITALSEDAFYDLLRQRVRESDGHDAFVFVHGFNVSFKDAARRTAQLAHDLEFKGAPVLFSWPSCAKVQGYTVDEATIDWVLPHLNQFLQGIVRRGGVHTLHLIAHSMGNRAIARVLKELAIGDADVHFNQVLMAAPDIDRGEFLHLAEQVRAVSDRVTLYASARDKALQLSQKLHYYPRAGEAGDSIVVSEGVETIDASKVDTDFFGHCYCCKDRTLLTACGASLGS